MRGCNSLLVTQAKHGCAAMLRRWWAIGHVVGSRTTKITAGETKVATIVESRLLLIGRVSVEELNVIHRVWSGLTSVKANDKKQS